MAPLQYSKFVLIKVLSNFRKCLDVICRNVLCVNPTLLFLYTLMYSLNVMSVLNWIHQVIFSWFYLNNLFDEPTHYTGLSNPLIDLILVARTKRYHVPVSVFFLNLENLDKWVSTTLFWKMTMVTMKPNVLISTIIL
jgi:hypothetical protein